MILLGEGAIQSWGGRVNRDELVPPPNVESPHEEAAPPSADCCGSCCCFLLLVVWGVAEENEKDREGTRTERGSIRRVESTRRGAPPKTSKATAKAASEAASEAATKGRPKI